MFKSFSINNFRCFRDFTIEPLERMNLIAGMNNVGKTALLEAIFLHIGFNNPQLPLSLDHLRGIQQVEINAEDMWGWWFYYGHIDSAIELTRLEHDNERHSLKIRLAEPETSTILPADKGDDTTSPLSETPTTSAESRELILEFHRASGETSISRASITKTSDGKNKIIHVKSLMFQKVRGIFISTHALLSKDNTEIFSKLERANRIEKEVLPIMQLLEPRLSRLALLLSGGVTAIHGDIGIGELVPITLMGEGMGRLLSIVLGIRYFSEGIVLIDEIENGLHHSVMVNVWKAIAEAARQSDTQVFATTHSWECIQAAHVAFMESEKYDFRLHRLDRIDEDIKPVTYDQEMLDTALPTDLEVR